LRFLRHGHRQEGGPGGRRRQGRQDPERDRSAGARAVLGPAPSPCARPRHATLVVRAAGPSPFHAPSIPRRRPRNERTVWTAAGVRTNMRKNPRKTRTEPVPPLIIAGRPQTRKKNP